MKCEDFREEYRDLNSQLTNAIYPMRWLEDANYRKKIDDLCKHEASCPSCKIFAKEFEEVYKKAILYGKLSRVLEGFGTVESFSEHQVATMIRRRFIGPRAYKPIDDSLEPVLRHFTAESKTTAKELREALLKWLEEKSPQ